MQILCRQRSNATTKPKEFLKVMIQQNLLTSKDIWYETVEKKPAG